MLLFICFIGADFLSVLAVDYDEGDNARVTYSLLNIPQDGNGIPLFAIDGTSGMISTTDTADIDREVIESYTVVAQAVDNPIQDGQTQMTCKKMFLYIKYTNLRFKRNGYILLNVGHFFKWRRGGIYIHIFQIILQ